MNNEKPSSEKSIHEVNTELAAENAMLKKFILDQCVVFPANGGEPIDPAPFLDNLPATDKFIQELIREHCGQCEKPEKGESK